MRLLFPHACCFVLGSMVAFTAAGCDHDHDGNGPDTEVGCAEDTRVEPYVVGSEKTGAQGLVLFRMGSLNPDPVDVGDNGWGLSLEEVATGNPLSGCTLEATPFMPDHNHGSNNKPIKGLHRRLDALLYVGCLIVCGQHKRKVVRHLGTLNPW